MLTRLRTRCTPPVVVLLVCAALPVADARMRPAEKAALWSLYEATGGATWTHNTNWDPTKEPCRKFVAPVPYRFDDPQTVALEDAQFAATPWYGVGCIDPCDDYLDGTACTAGRTSSLQLRANGLSGDLSGWTAVGELANLTCAPGDALPTFRVRAAGGCSEHSLP